MLRGRSMRRRVYNPDRLKYPMKRIGKRGEGKFKRITWEEAYDEVAGTMQRLSRITVMTLSTLTTVLVPLVAQ